MNALPSSEPETGTGDINVVSITNLFHEAGNEDVRLAYNHYCSITQDFDTYHVDPEALRVLESFGYPRQMVIHDLNKGVLNHATTTYNLLVTT